MSGKSISRAAVVVLALFMVTGLFLVDSNAQKPKRKRRPAKPQITNPEIYQPPANENSSGDTATTDANTNSSKTQSEKDAEAMKKTIENLSGQVDKLTDKLNQME